MKSRLALVMLAALAAVAGPARGLEGSFGPPDEPLAQDKLGELQRQVGDTERAFARTMADRDHTAFVSFLADEAVFLGQQRTLRGRKQVADGWKPFYDGPQPPFSWSPDRVEVLDSGTLALSTGPVLDPQGKRTGTFNSVWRLEGDGKWRIVFDKGCPPCDCR